MLVKKGDIVVDFCGGSGHISVVLALRYQHLVCSISTLSLHTLMSVVVHCRVLNFSSSADTTNTALVPELHHYSD